MTDKSWRVQLGDEHWARFTYARTEESEFRLLGSVARNAQVGALAETADGQYLQVNGDHVTPLAAGQVKRAIEAARRTAPRVQVRRDAHPAPAPVVIIKRRRRIPETGHST